MDIDPDKKTEHLKGIHQLVSTLENSFLAQHFTRYGYEMSNKDGWVFSNLLSCPRVPGACDACKSCFGNSGNY